MRILSVGLYNISALKHFLFTAADYVSNISASERIYKFYSFFNFEFLDTPKKSRGDNDLIFTLAHAHWNR